MPQISLVTVLFKSDAVLEGFFRSLHHQDFAEYQLIIIDNSPSAATDSIVAELQVKYAVPSLIHIRNKKNVGVAAANNQGIEISRYAGCTHTLLLNNDIEFDQPALISSMLNCAIKNNERLIVPKIYYYDSRKIWMAGGVFNEYKGIALHTGVDDDDNEIYSRSRHIEYAPTCFMLIGNSVFDRIGVMDERYFVYYDDTDFVYRAKLAGYRIYYMAELSVLHKVNSSTGGGESLFSIFYNTRNRIFYIRKNMSGVKLISSLVFTVITRLIRALRGTSRQRAEFIRAIQAGFQMSLRE